MDAEPFRFRRTGRNRATLLSVLSIWAALVAAIVLVDAAVWLMGIIALVTVPAVWDLVANPPAGLDLTTKELTWFSGRRTGQLARGEIERIRFDTRLDLAVNARVHLVTGTVMRLPIEAVPPYKRFCDALDQAGIRHERHHFGFF